MSRRGADLGGPVLCIGNLVVGGAGKTPAAIAVARLLQAEGRNPAFLSRGYGRTSRGTRGWLRVEPDMHDAAQAGDEPLLLARVAPTFVAADRTAAARAALAEGADVLILDDGLQNPSLRKDWTMAVADGVSGFGNGLCIPAGPLRAPAGLQWPAVRLLCVIGEGASGDRVIQSARVSGVPITRAALLPDRAIIARLRGQRLFAFAGIGRPEKFFATLRAAQLDVVGARAFPDHHMFTASDLSTLDREAAGCRLVTTAKDRVRLPTALEVETLPVELVFDDPDVVRGSIPLSL